MGMALPLRGAMFLPYRLIDAALLHPAALTQFVRPLLALFCEPQQRLDCLLVGNTASQPIAALCCFKQPVIVHCSCSGLGKSVEGGILPL